MSNFYKHFPKLWLACLPLAMLSACGGGDTEDRLDVADPVVRFVDASAITPAVTLYRGTVAQSDATNVSYPFASNYFDVDMGASDWTVKAAATGTTLGTVSIDPARGTKYTIVEVPALNADGGAILVVDPYNKSLTSDSARLRIVNATFNASNIDLYMTATADISTANPVIAATAYKTAGPISGSDSRDIPGGAYQLTITTAGTKTVLFKGQVSFAANQDLLVVSVPDATSATGVKAIIKAEGTAGANDVPPAPAT